MTSKTFSSLLILLCLPASQAADILLVTEDIASPTSVGPIAGVDFENPANTAYDRTPDDLDLTDGISVSADWTGPLMVIEDSGAQVSPTSGSFTGKIDEGSSAANPPNTTPTGDYASWSITIPVSYTHLRAHETREDLVCRLLLEKKKKK